MKTHAIANKAAWCEALGFLEAFCPRKDWPLRIRTTLFKGTTICYKERLLLTVFLYGNGVPDKHIRVLLQPVLRDRASAEHVNTILADVKGCNYDNIWYYFNVHRKDYLYLNGLPCDFTTLKKHGRYISYTMLCNRKIDTWSKFCCTQNASVYDRELFFRHINETDPWVFFRNTGRAYAASES